MTPPDDESRRKLLLLDGISTPKNQKWQLEEGESFSTEVVTKRNVLYEKFECQLRQK